MPGGTPAGTSRQQAASPATAMMMPAGTASPTCPNGSTSAAAPPKTTTRSAAAPRPGRPRRSPPSSTSPSRPAPPTAGPPPPATPAAGDYSTPATPAACCKPPPPIPAAAAASPCWPPTTPPPDSGQRNRDGPDARQAAALTAFLRDLNITVTPIARGTCDHRNAEDRYTPSRKLTHLVRARTATCPAPGCGAHADHCDLDHTTPHPDGPTDECNLGPPCRRHHQVKQAPGWTLTQPEPGVMRWITPAGRTYTTRPTVYEM